MNLKPFHLTDGYKLDHRRQYPPNITKVYSNFTARGSRIPGVNKVIFFGLQYFIVEFLIKLFNKDFFHKDIKDISIDYTRRINAYLGPNTIGTEHIEALWKLGYLPIEIKALPEGTFVPIGVPMLTIQNTHPDFAWLTNYLEILISCELWKPITVATIAFEYRKQFEKHAKKTGYERSFIGWQGHDFSFRGMSGVIDAMKCGAAHLLSFDGTDTFPAIDFIEEFYIDLCTEYLMGGSVPATEHSVMCAGSKESELETYRRLITELYPTGVVSIVSDTWDLWKVITEYLPALKGEILARDGRVVIRPDSGDPVDIICGYEKSFLEINNNRLEAKGAYELLWDIFGGTINKNGYKELNPKIGLIYGDAITLDRQKEIIKRLEAKGFCASNLVLGIGSYTYQYITRDTFGMAMKSTYDEINGQGCEIYKDPVTDSGTKKSAKGLLMVYEKDGEIYLKDQCTKEEEQSGLLQTAYKDGIIKIRYRFKEIRDKVLNQLSKEQ